MKILMAGCLLSCVFASMCSEKKVISEDPSYHRSGLAYWRVEGSALSYCLWYNPDQWMIFSNPIYNTQKTDQEWLLVLLDRKDRTSIGKASPIKSTAFTFVYEDKNLTQTEIKNRVVHNLLSTIKGLKDFEDLGSSERKVNGIDVFMWKIKFGSEELGEQISMNYYYSGEEGSISIVTLTPLEHWEMNKDKVEGLLNGFCTLAKEKTV